jgi:hypothetical protein
MHKLAMDYPIQRASNAQQDLPNAQQADDLSYPIINSWSARNLYAIS